MTDNTDEEELGNSTNTQSDNPSDEITPTADSEAINSTQETENMEVHHHPNLHHKPKKWKEYFLEFLMIFLAVALGFFAETLREKISEKQREKDYMVGLANNIRNDTSALNGLISRNDLEIKGIDSLISISKNHIDEGCPIPEE